MNKKVALPCSPLSLSYYILRSSVPPCSSLRLSTNATSRNRTRKRAACTTSAGSSPSHSHHPPVHVGVGMMGAIRKARQPTSGRGYSAAKLHRRAAASSLLHWGHGGLAWSPCVLCMPAADGTEEWLPPWGRCTSGRGNWKRRSVWPWFLSSLFSGVWRHFAAIQMIRTSWYRWSAGSAVVVSG
jgi:hypothetical protein